MKRPDRRAILRLAAVAVPSLALATVAVSFLQDTLGVPNPSALYLVAVVATALVAGTVGALATSVAAFLLYNYLFTEPRYTLSMDEPGVWLSVVLLLFVGIVTGELAAVIRSRADTARAREREARALFRLSRALATRASTGAALADISEVLVSETRAAATWVALGSETAERTVASAGAIQPPAEMPGVLNILRRAPGDEPATWVRVHRSVGRPPRGATLETFRVRIEANRETLGSIWLLRERGWAQPDSTETRLLSAAADQVGQALAQDRFAADSQTAEVARQSDALKSALLQSVSHDLRTPLATIRAAAGTIARDGLDPAARRDSAEAIDREAQYLNRMVSNLLDLSRIDAGVLHPEKEVFELEDVIGSAIERLQPRLGARSIELALQSAPVEGDPVMLDQAFTNLIENALRHTPADAPLRVTAQDTSDSTVRLTVEDGGRGVPSESLGRLFDKFYRVPVRHAETREGTGIGLAVVRGLIEAMDGKVAARPSDLGGLAIDIELARAPVPEASFSGEA